MLHLDKEIPIKDTYNYLSKFPRFSLIEKMEPRFFPTSTEASIAAATIIKNEILRKNAKGQTCVLGLATGSTPLRVYKELIHMHKNGEVSFKNVVTFNLDQYFPITKQDPQSYNYYMNFNLFDHIDIPKENINIPNGEIERSEVTNFCLEYEKKIASYGGIDIQILGIGRTGHIGFNQPPSPIKSITRLVYLHRLTRKDAANSFGGIEKVPKCAISMGIDTIKKAKKIIIMAWGQSKASIVKSTIEGEVKTDIPSTFLHDHQDIIFFLDKAAGQYMTRFNTPWVIRGDIEDPIVPKSSYWVLKSVTWLSQKIKKPILRLTYDDYEDHNLSQLVVDCAEGSVEDLNLYVYKKINTKITGWPLGNRPNEYIDISSEKKMIRKQSLVKETVLIFSPHPDDDVISMGGTIKKLIEQGHEVHVAYMTSRANGVNDLEARKYVYFLKDFSNEYFWNIAKNEQDKHFITEFTKLIQDADEVYDKQEEDRKTDLNWIVKKIIRSSEAKVALNFLGIKASRAYCLELPFYGTNHFNRTKPGKEDYQAVRSLLRLIEPTVIFAAGDLADPHGTHRICLQILIHLFQSEHQKAKETPHYRSLMPSAQNFFLYRGAWQEWSIPMARIIIPLSPKDVNNKTMSIWKHQSQKDGPMFLGQDKREFWQRAKERNRLTAQTLNGLGFSDYQACECFVNFNDLMNYDQF